MPTIKSQYTKKTTAQKQQKPPAGIKPAAAFGILLINGNDRFHHAFPR
jgi:hypothetical protein